MDIILQSFPSGIFNDIPNVTLVIGLIISLIQCFFGYKIIRSWITIAGFLLGAISGYALVYSITANATYALIGCLIGAILLSVLAYKIYLVGVFLIAGFGTYYICISCLTVDSSLLQPISIVLAIVAAFFAIKYMRPAIIFVTAFQGALAAVEVLPVFIAFDQTIAFPVGIGLGLIGAVIQFITTKKE